MTTLSAIIYKRCWSTFHLLVATLSFVGCSPSARFGQSACDQLPTVAAVKQTVADHDEVRAQIEQINPGFVMVEIDEVEQCPGKAMLHISYATVIDQERIKQLIGNTFFGVPYTTQNT
jgi:hypothetical protein